MNHSVTQLVDEAATFWTQSSNSLQQAAYTPIPRIDAKTFETERDFALVFLRDYVAKSKPCIIDHLHEFTAWPLVKDAQTFAHLESYLCEKVTGNVRVNVTPNGRADSITDISTMEIAQPDTSSTTFFMKPCCVEMVGRSVVLCA